MASSQGAPPKAVVTFIIKNPAMPEGWQLDGVPVDATLQQVKELIAQRYPGNPDPSQQTVSSGQEVCVSQQAFSSLPITREVPLGDSTTRSSSTPARCSRTGRSRSRRSSPR